jgi:hypothetical protein
MNVSHISSTDRYSSTLSFPPKASQSNPLQQAVKSLANNLKSGDTASAASEVSDIIAHTSKDSGSSRTDRSRSADGSSGADDLNTYLKSLQTALAAGDTASAQSLVASLQNYLSANPPASGGTYSADGNYNSVTGSNAISTLA